MATHRIAFVDGLRGLAASMVCLLHCGMYSVAHSALGSSDAPLAKMVDVGRYGVQIFFVISGFVICLALRARVDLRFAGRFILRRIIRLDPPYWASIAFVVGLGALIAGVVGETPRFPSSRTVVAHLFYAQGILGMPSLSIVYWTLCIEVQFYLLFLVLTAIAQRTGIRIEIVSAPLLLASLWLIDSSDSPAWIWPHYALFWLGSAVANAYRGGGGLGALMLGSSACAARLVVAWNPQLFIGLLTAIAILAAWKCGGLQTWLGSRVWQFLGTISYSLYLTHTDVAYATSLVYRRLFPERLGVWLVLEFIASIAFAWLFYLAVERPSVRLSTRLRAPQEK